MTFQVFGPNDATCAKLAVFTSSVPVSGNGTYASTAFAPPAPGTYRFVASYSGDVNNVPVPGACNAPNENVTVPAPVIAVTKAASPASLPEPGGTFTFTVRVSNPSAVDAVKITSLLDNIYGDLATRAGSTCGGLIGTTLAPGATSPACSFTGTFTGTSGQSQTDIVTVTGIDSNGFQAPPASANATVTLTPRSGPAVSTQVSGPFGPNGAIADTATLTGGNAPSGTMTFQVFGPNDATCAKPAVFTTSVPVSGNGTYASSAFAAPAPGTYRFVASYSGDANNVPVPGACNAPNENVTVPAPVIGVTKAASPASLPAPGGTFTFTVTVSNPSAVDAVKITSLLDNIYGDLATRAGSTCGGLIGTTLAPGATSPACSFTGTFTGTSGQSQTDIVTVTGIDSNGFAAPPATARATVMLTPPVTPPGPQIAVTKAASPTSLAAPGGTFTFKVTVSNPSTVQPITITKLTDNIYGDLATRAGSNCGALIGVTLAPGATSAPCSFSGTFTGTAGQSQTDVVTATGMNNGVTVSATANATVTLTPGAAVIKPAAVVSSSTLHRPAGCVKASAKLYVTGHNIKSVSYSLDGRHVRTVSTADSNGRYAVTIATGSLSLRAHQIVAVVTYRNGTTRTLHSTVVRCQPPRLPLFTG